MDSFLLRDLAVVIAVAGGTTLLCRVLRQPVVIGYLLAGLIIGPHTPPFTLVHDLHSIHTMAELGLVVLMFVLGLEFSLPKLRNVGMRALLATILEIFGMLAIGYGVGRSMGWSQNDSVYLGAILSISSTTIIVKVLGDLKLVKEDFAQAVFGILILEDIAAVVILTVLSGLGIQHGNEGLTVLRALIKVGFFVSLFLILGLALVPRLLRWIESFKSSEMMGLIAFGLCLGGALMAQHFGFSVALGAFLAGAVIAASPEAETVERWIHPIRDLFSALFFVSAGLLIDPKLLWSIKGPVAVVATVTVIGKMLTGAVGSFLAGYPLKTSFRIGMTLAQIGEFSFVFASLGMKTGLGSEFLYPLAVAVSAMTTLLTPYLIRGSDATVDTLLRWLPARTAQRLERGRTVSAEKPKRMGIVSRYVWRLGIYGILLTAGFLLTKGLEQLLPAGHPWGVVALWSVSWIVQLPLLRGLAGYINHFLLLHLTELAIRWRMGRLLQKIPIQRTYDVFEAVLWLAVTLVWVARPALPRLGTGATLLGLVILAVLAYLGRSLVQHAYVGLEALLDEIFGLASSEPLRRAAIAVDGVDSLLNESIRRVMVGKTSPAAHRSLRELRLREQTGASVIGIYRDGVLNANPSPETILKPADILVLLGDAPECRRAMKFLEAP